MPDPPRGHSTGPTRPARKRRQRRPLPAARASASAMNTARQPFSRRDRTTTGEDLFPSALPTTGGFERLRQMTLLRSTRGISQVYQRSIATWSSEPLRQPASPNYGRKDLAICYELQRRPGCRDTPASQAASSGNYGPCLPLQAKLRVTGSVPKTLLPRTGVELAIVMFAPCLLGCRGTIRQRPAPDGTGFQGLPYSSARHSISRHYPARLNWQSSGLLIRGLPDRGGGCMLQLTCDVACACR